MMEKLLDTASSHFQYLNVWFWNICFSSLFEGDPNKEIHFTCYFQYEKKFNISNNTVSWRSSLKPHTIKTNSGIQKII